MKTCWVTCTGTTGNSMTSRVRWTQPPVRCVPQSGQFSTTCSTRWVGVRRGRAKPWRRCLRGCCCAGGWRPELDLRPGIRGGPPGFRLAFQFGNPPLQPHNHHLQLGNDRLLLHDDGNQHIAVDGGEVNFSIHALYMT